MTYTYSISGLGKLGASMAAAIASRGFDVIGVDVNENAVAALNDGRTPVQETGLAEMIAANRERLRATTDQVEAIRRSDITFVVVPTPSDETGMFSLQYARWAFHEIGRALREKDGYHNVVLTSTVVPGSTRYGLLPILEAGSGRKCGPDFGLCYSPEFIALGSVIRDFLNPDFNLIGEIDDRAGSQLEDAYAAIVENGAPSKRMSIENAELTKLAVNTYVTTKITYANMLAEYCERLPGGDVDVVADALGADARIGRKYLTGGLGFGGPCFPRDNGALTAFGHAVGYDSRLPAATDAINRAQPDMLAGRIAAMTSRGGTVGVLGLSYKPMSHVVEESPGIALALALAAKGLRVVGYDPLARETARAVLRDKAVVLESAEAVIAQSDVVVIANPDPAFAELDAGAFPQKSPGLVVFDCWRLLDGKLSGASGIDYRAIGRGSAEAAAPLAALWGNQG